MTVMTSWVDASVGETRRALVRDGVPMMLQVSRWSDAGRRALWGETYIARVRSVDRRLRGAFVDLGLPDAHGFVRLDAQGRARTQSGLVPLTEGLAVRAVVRREAANGKNAVLDVSGVVDDGGAPHRETAYEEDASAGDAETRARLDALVEASLRKTAPIPDGGVLTIERTAALVAIDVDAGARGGARDPSRFAEALNIDAAREAARQLRLRALGGIIAIDFVSMREAKARTAVVEALRAAVADDPWGVIVAPMSRFGVVEMSRGQLRAPLAETMCDESGALTAESEALAALRAVEREVRVARGRVVWLSAGAETHAWLAADQIGWRAALTARIGARWDLRRDERLGKRAWTVEAE